MQLPLPIPGVGQMMLIPTHLAHLQLKTSGVFSFSGMARSYNFISHPFSYFLDQSLPASLSFRI